MLTSICGKNILKKNNYKRGKCNGKHLFKRLVLVFKDKI